MVVDHYRRFCFIKIQERKEKQEGIESLVVGYQYSITGNIRMVFHCQLSFID